MNRPNIQYLNVNRYHQTDIWFTCTSCLWSDIQSYFVCNYRECRTRWKKQMICFPQSVYQTFRYEILSSWKSIHRQWSYLEKILRSNHWLLVTLNIFFNSYIYFSLLYIILLLPVALWCKTALNRYAECDTKIERKRKKLRKNVNTNEKHHSPN